MGLWQSVSGIGFPQHLQKGERGAVQGNKTHEHSGGGELRSIAWMDPSNKMRLKKKKKKEKAD